MKLTKEQENEMMFYFIRFGQASTEAMDIFPFIEDYMDKHFLMQLDTQYVEKFTAKGKRKRELEKAYKEDFTRYTKRKKSFIKQWNDLAMRINDLGGKFGDLFNKFLDEHHDLNEKHRKEFLQFGKK